ncbi:cupin domain-containing protein [Thioflavicoccus mobilis 8321]|uniref:Cupin domain-containing protein n=1 Tax=Thioflavicoccus mobilis 8321 TaxID=765912 RepID=L0GYJ1_9GAMM|nr:cupin domain-containing protein [Thioflavicoccus mobilis]AGA90892.1 cupin domain-containing protein [Thioflavicoccus mobilis 8321]
MENLFADLPVLATGEAFDELMRCRNVRIERIASSPVPGSVWYDQPHDEWVVLLTGQARLEMAGEVLEMGPGDHLFIPARTWHRVLATSDEPRCLWLAVHIDP